MTKLMAKSHKQKTFKFAKTDAQLTALVTEHAPLVKRIALHLKARLPASVQVDDLYQAGMIGLIEAVRKYDDSQGAKFETYAGIRIRGAMLDELRRNDWAPKSVHRKGREIAEAIRQVENRTGRDARDQEIADALQLPLDEYHKMLRENNACIISMEQYGMDEDSLSDRMSDSESDPYRQLQDERFKHSLAKAIAGLPERECLVVSLYYESELNLREIGSIIGVTESRVSQLLNQAQARLRARLTDWLKH